MRAMAPRTRARVVSCLARPTLAAPSIAATQVSNLSEPLGIEFTADGAHFAHASSFTTDASAYQLQSITVSVLTNTTGSAELRLRADSAGSPGAVIASLGTQTLPSNQGQVPADLLLHGDRARR